MSINLTSDIHLVDNPPLSARYFAYQNEGSTTPKSYYIGTLGRDLKTEEGYQQKWSKISVIAYTQNPKEYLKVEDDLLPVAKAIANYWQPVTTWSWVVLTIADADPALIIITGAMLLIISAFAVYLEIKKSNKSKTHIHSNKRL